VLLNLKNHALRGRRYFEGGSPPSLQDIQPIKFSEQEQQSDGQQKGQDEEPFGEDAQNGGGGQ
jgi:hypothetical protein